MSQDLFPYQSLCVEAPENLLEDENLSMILRFLWGTANIRSSSMRNWKYSAWSPPNTRYLFKTSETNVGEIREKVKVKERGCPQARIRTDRFRWKTKWHWCPRVIREKCSEMDDRISLSDASV